MVLPILYGSGNLERRIGPTSVSAYSDRLIPTRIATEAFKLASYSKKSTISSRGIQTSVRLILPGELSKHAISEGTKSVIKFLAYKKQTILIIEQSEAHSSESLTSRSFASIPNMRRTMFILWSTPTYPSVTRTVTTRSAFLYFHNPRLRGDSHLCHHEEGGIGDCQEDEHLPDEVAEGRSGDNLSRKMKLDG